MTTELAGILFITSYPPRECGIATYSHDLIKALDNKFSSSLSIKVCALEWGESNFTYPEEVRYILDTSEAGGYKPLALSINNDKDVQIVLIQHEFGFFRAQEKTFRKFLKLLTKPVVVVFHTVLPNPSRQLKVNVKNMTAACQSVIVMTNTSADILTGDYGLRKEKISVIAHGTHLVPHLGERLLKKKYGLKGRKVLTTFGLLSSGKSIETTIEALPDIIRECPEAVFLVIGKTHPEVKRFEGEKYRESLELKVKQLALGEHVIFINKYLETPVLLEYLQLTDIYLFTSSDPNQAVSGTFVYAMSCACPIISTPIPHAKEVLTKDTGIIFDFRNSGQLADGVIRLLSDGPLRRSIGANTLQKIVSTVWENSAVAHALLFENIAEGMIEVRYNHPPLKMSHLQMMTNNTGIIQFSKINQPDICSGYTLDDNARALVAMCMYFKVTADEKCLSAISKYLRFVSFCIQPDANFLNYVDMDGIFTKQNKEVNLDDSNGRALWALGYTVSMKGLLPEYITSEAEALMERSLVNIGRIFSTRAMAFVIKGLYFFDNGSKSPRNLAIIETFAKRLVQMYRHEANKNWEWFEAYLTYANSILPEAMLYSWLLTGDSTYRDIAISSFNFLLKQTFNENGIEVISNKNWLQKGQVAGLFGEQPVDVAYTIMTLHAFSGAFSTGEYHDNMNIAFNWFLGNNRLHQIIYNPCTGGCYDGLEENHVNLNQGAESTISYLLARLTMELQIR